ncbi:hypothetical protein ACFPGN_24555, partial [Aquimarina hainanensis]
MKKIFQFFIPPKPWRIPVIILSGALTGLTIYTLIESKAVSYLSDDRKHAQLSCNDSSIHHMGKK